VVPAGAALGPLALTQKPRVFEGAGGSWTLETTTHRHPVLGFAFQPKGGRVAVASADGTVRLYDAKTWAFQKAVVPPVPVGSLAWTPDGKQLITVPAHAAAAGPVGKGAVLAWDADAAKAVQEFTAFAGRQYAAPVAVSADGKWVAVATAQFGAGPGGKYKFAVEVAKLGEGGEPVELVFEDAQAVGVSWGPAAAQDKPPVLAVGYRNGDIRLWDLGKDRPEIVRTLGTGTPELKRVAWSPDGKKLAAHAGGKLVVWFGEKRLDLTGGDDFAWSPTGDRLAAALGHLGVRVYDTTAPGGKFTDLKVPALRVAWSPDGKALAVTHLGGMEVRLHDPASGKLLHAIPATDGLAFNADEGFFREPKGNNPFVFVVQTEKGQETLTPEAFGKRTGWKNDPDKVFLIGK
jgi:WD40 repeat protein